MITDRLRTGIDRLRTAYTTVRDRLNRLAGPNCGITGRLRVAGRTVIERVGNDPEE